MLGLISLQAFQIQIVYNGTIKTLEKRYSELHELHKRVRIVSYITLEECFIDLFEGVCYLPKTWHHYFLILDSLLCVHFVCRGCSCSVFIFIELPLNLRLKYGFIYYFSRQLC